MVRKIRQRSMTQGSGSWSRKCKGPEVGDQVTGGEMAGSTVRPARPCSHQEEPGFVIAAVGSHWKVLSRRLKWPDIVPYKNGFGYSEKNGRERGKNGSRKAVRPGLDSRGRGWALTATEHPSPLLLTTEEGASQKPSLETSCL